MAVGGLLAAGGYGLFRYVLDPAERLAAGPVPAGDVRSAAHRTYSPPPAVPTTVVRRRPGTAGAPAPAAVAAALDRLTPGRRRSIVAVSGGYEAAAYDQYGDIDFWAFVPPGWHLLAHRLYPAYTAGALSGPAVKVSGTVLTGMADATFIVDGPFSPTGRDVAYTVGPAGWGVVVAAADGRLVPSGGSLTGPGIGLESADHVVGGRLETVDDPPVFTPTFAAAYPVVRTWAWSGGAFTLASANVVTAQPAPVPAGSEPPLPSAVPGSGTYTAGVVAVTEAGPGIDPPLRLTLRPAARLPGCEAAPGIGCYRYGTATTSVVVGSAVPTVYAATTRAALAFVTGPAWALGVPGGLCCRDGYPSPPTGLTTYGLAPWYVPPGLGLAAFVDGAEPVLDLTFAHGAVVALAEPAG